jgi:hypothetical protein
MYAFIALPMPLAVIPRLESLAARSPAQMQADS